MKKIKIVIFAVVVSLLASSFSSRVQADDIIQNYIQIPLGVHIAFPLYLDKNDTVSVAWSAQNGVIDVIDVLFMDDSNFAIFNATPGAGSFIYQFNRTRIGTFQYESPQDDGVYYLVFWASYSTNHRFYYYIHIDDYEEPTETPTEPEPESPIPELQPITPNPNTDGNIHLNWNDIPDATVYHVYRDTTPITDVSGLTPIASPTHSHHADTGLSDGVYHYVVTAVVGTESDPSNGQSVIVQTGSGTQQTIPGLPLWVLIGISGIVVIMLVSKLIKKRVS